MSHWRVGLVLLPQAWVVQAYSTFHEAAMAAPVASFEAAGMAVQVDSIAVMAVGWLTVAVNLLIAAALVWVIVTADGRTRRHRATASLRSRSDRVAMSVPRPAVVPALPATSVISSTPFEQVAPRPPTTRPRSS